MAEKKHGSNNVRILETSISDLYELETPSVSDDRGDLRKVFSSRLPVIKKLFPEGAIQANIVRTKNIGTVRGLHWQQPSITQGEAKLVFCLTGRVFDVAVDIREDSRTRFHFHSVELRPENNRGLLIPPGFAHGMQALENNSALLYFHSTHFEPELERGLNPMDEIIRIPWPLPISNMSERDKGHPTSKEIKSEMS